MMGGWSLLVILQQPIRNSTANLNNPDRLYRGQSKRKDPDMPKRDAVFPANRHALYNLHQYSPAIRSGDPEAAEAMYEELLDLVFRSGR